MEPEGACAVMLCIRHVMPKSTNIVFAFITVIFLVVKLKILHVLYLFLIIRVGLINRCFYLVVRRYVKKSYFFRQKAMHA